MQVRGLGISVHLTIPLMHDGSRQSDNINKCHQKKTLVLDLLIEKFSYIKLLIRFKISNFIMFKRKLFKRYSADPGNMQRNKK